MKVHKETKELRFNVLTVAKAGPKFGSQFHQSDDRQPGVQPSYPSPMASSQHYPQLSMKEFCGVVQARLLVTFEGGAVVEHASSAADIPPVIDRAYDITIDTAAHEPWPAMLEHQLGLKLEQQKLPVEVVVIDSASRPTSN